MKMRKIIAIMAAVLMLCAIVPMGALVSAAETPAIDKDFNDGANPFNGGSVVAEGPDGSNCLKWTASGGYSATYITINGVEKNADYVITFKAKSSVDGPMGITIQNAGWGSYYTEYFNTETEWKEYTIETNVAEHPTSSGGIMFKFQDQGKAMDLYIDDLVMVKKSAEEPEEPDQPEEDEYEYAQLDGIQNWTEEEAASMDGFGAKYSISDKALIGDAKQSLKMTATMMHTRYCFANREKNSGPFSAKNPYKLTNAEDGKLSDYEGIAIAFSDENGQQIEISKFTARLMRNINDWNSYWNYEVNYTDMSTCYKDGYYYLSFADYKNLDATGIDALTIMSVLFYCDVTTGESAYISDMKAYRKVGSNEIPKEPSFDGYIYNGDFEANGSWSLNGTAAIKAGVGKDGTRGIELYGDASWGNGFVQTVAVEANTDYIISFDYKGAISGMYVKKNGSSTIINPWPKSDDWQKMTYPFNSGDATSITVSFNGCEVTDVKYIDNIKLEKAIEPSFDGFITNGDFETGDLTGGWEGKGLAVTEAAAKDGKYGVHLTGGTWDGLCGWVNVTPNTNYTLTFDYNQTVGGSYGIFIKDESKQNDVASAWPNGDANQWHTFSINFNSGNNSKVYLQLCTGENRQKYIDNVKMIEVKEPSFDGFITNGDFETGDLTGGWEGKGLAVTEAAAKDGKYGVHLTGGTWDGLSGWVNVTPNTNYTLTFDYNQTVGGSYGIFIKDESKQNDVASAWPNGDANQWHTYKLSFNSGANSKVYLQLCTGENRQKYIDNVTLAEVKEPSFDGYVTNGDFETGDTKGWTVDDWCAASVSVSDAVKYEGDYALALNGGWANAKQTLALKANTVYALSFYYSGRGLFFMKELGITDGIYLDNVNEMTKYTYVFNSGDVTSAVLELSAPDNLTYYDNVSLAEYECTDHVIDDACLGGICSICGTEVAPAHSVKYVEAVTPTCTVNGNIEYWYCETCGQAWLDAACTQNTNLKAVVLPMAEHTYADDLDVNCDVCGKVRVVEYAVITFGGNSISEDVNGLAFKFNVNTTYADVNLLANTKFNADYSNSTISPDSTGTYKLVGMGAVMSNNYGVTELDHVDGANIINVKAEKVAVTTAETCFVIRILNIPEANRDTTVSARPYFIYENAEGEQITVYGQEVMSTYNGAQNG